MLVLRTTSRTTHSALSLSSQFLSTAHNLLLGRYHTLARVHKVTNPLSNPSPTLHMPSVKMRRGLGSLLWHGFSQVKPNPGKEQPGLSVIKKACGVILPIDNIKVDELCLIFGTHYLPAHKTNSAQA